MAASGGYFDYLRWRLSWGAGVGAASGGFYDHVRMRMGWVSSPALSGSAAAAGFYDHVRMRMFYLATQERLSLPTTPPRDEPVPIFEDIELSREQRATLVISLRPPTPIGGQTIRWQMKKVFGTDVRLVERWVGSGTNGASGITILNSGQGQFKVELYGDDTSGLEYGNYATASDVILSGTGTGISPLGRGFVVLYP